VVVAHGRASELLASPTVGRGAVSDYSTYQQLGIYSDRREIVRRNLPVYARN
jgi:hypothetical protein